MHSSSRFRSFVQKIGICAYLLCLSPSMGIDVATVEASVYRIVNLQEKSNGTGTGFLINSQGILVTNYHVTDGASKLYVVRRMEHKIKVWPAEVLYVSGAKDLAIIRAPGVTGEPLRLSSKGAQKGSEVYAFGFPGQADRLDNSRSAFIQALAASGGSDIPISDLYENFVRCTVKTGNIEDIRMTPWGYPAESGRVQAILHSAPFTGGNSGGPLVDNSLQVIGVNTIVQGESALNVKDAGKVLTGNLVRVSSSVSELIAILNEQKISYFTGANAVPTGELADQAKKQENISSSSTPVSAPSHKSGGSWVLYAVAALLILAALLVGIITWVVVLNRKKSSKGQPAPAGGQKKPSPAGQPHGASMGLLGVLAGRDLEGRNYRFSIHAEQFRAKQGRLIIGRSASHADLHIDNTSLSRAHAELHLREGALYVVDLNSSNGTKVNRHVLAPAKQAGPLAFGDQLQVGEVSLTFAAT